LNDYGPSPSVLTAPKVRSITLPTAALLPSRDLNFPNFQLSFSDIRHDISGHTPQTSTGRAGDAGSGFESDRISERQLQLDPSGITEEKTLIEYMQRINPVELGN